MYSMGDINLSWKNFKYYFGCLKFVIFLGLTVDAGAGPKYEENIREPTPSSETKLLL